MIELGDGHYWINDPGLMVDIPIKFVGDEEDPSHVVLELSGEISWKAAGGWMEGITVRRPKMISGASPKNDLLRIESGGRLDVYHCVFDNRGSVGNCVSMTGTGSGGHWVKATLQGASRDCSGLFVGQYACAELIDVSSAVVMAIVLRMSIFHRDTSNSTVCFCFSATSATTLE
jgi:hypothetical protein